MNPPTTPPAFNEPNPYPWSYSKLACPCCGHSVIDFRLYYTLRQLYGITQGAFRITSLARCAAHNHAIGGAPESRHIYGLAADLAPTKGDLHALADAALHLRPVRLGGFGYYPTLGIIHVDLRRKPARWVKDSNGFHPLPDLWPILRAKQEENQCPEQLFDPQPDPRPPQQQQP